jgi:hypothetical protein
MIFVPMPMYDHGHRLGGGYRFIFDKSNTGVAFFQLLVNVTFAALLGAITANLSKRTLRVITPSKRALRVIATCVAVALIGLGVFALVHFAERAKADEKSAEYVLRSSPDSSDYGFAIKKLRNAALNWRNALRFDEAKRLDERANIVEAQKAKADEEIEKRLAQEREFDRQRKTNAFLSQPTDAQIVEPTNPFADLIPQATSLTQDEEKLVRDPIDYQRGQWTTDWGKAFVVAKFFEHNLGDRKGELDALADQLSAQKRYMLIEKQKRGGVWWVRVFLYKR